MLVGIFVFIDWRDNLQIDYQLSIPLKVRKLPKIFSDFQFVI